MVSPPSVKWLLLLDLETVVRGSDSDCRNSSSIASFIDLLFLIGLPVSTTSSKSVEPSSFTNDDVLSSNGVYDMAFQGSVYAMLRS